MVPGVMDARRVPLVKSVGRCRIGALAPLRWPQNDWQTFTPPAHSASPGRLSAVGAATQALSSSVGHGGCDAVVVVAEEVVEVGVIVCFNC